MPSANKKSRKIQPVIVDYFPNMWVPDWEVPAFEPYSAHHPEGKYVKFWKKVIELLRHGMTIEGVFIHGWLIWHTIMWRIELDIMIGNKSFKQEGIPLFRDIEWICADDLNRGEQELRGWVLMGSRGTGKSNIAASMAGYYYTCYHDLEVVISAAGAPDIGPIAAKADYGLTRLDSRTLRKQRLMDNWRSEVRAGYKDMDGNRHGSNSRFYMRNFDEGNNTMACNGLRPKFHIFEEIGKLPNFKMCYNDSIMCWMNDFGQYGIPLGIGTGGDTEYGADAQEMFFDPIPYNLLEFEDTFEHRKKSIGRFIPVTQARNEYKERWTLYNYITEKLHRKVKYNKLLDSIPIMVSNEEKCMQEFVLPRRAIARQSTDPAKYNKEIAYYCLTPSEAFTSIIVNRFPTEALRAHKDWLYDNDIRGMNVQLYRSAEGLVEWVEKGTIYPVMDYPLTASSSREGCVVIFEVPEKDAPSYTYIAGADPYNQHQAPTSDSLGAFYIYKRIVTVTGTFQREIVAHYVGRPATMNEWHENVEMLMDLYNATCLPENEGSTFTQHFDQIGKLWMLADVFDFRKEVSPNSKTDRSKGLPATPAYISFCMNLLYDYVNEKLTVGYKLNPISHIEEPIIRMGYTRLRDPLLIQEMIDYDGMKNADRIIAFRHVLAYEKSLEKFGNSELPGENESTDKRPQSATIRTPFYLQPKSKVSSSVHRSPFYLQRK